MSHLTVSFGLGLMSLFHYAIKCRIDVKVRYCLWTRSDQWRCGRASNPRHTLNNGLLFNRGLLIYSATDDTCSLAAPLHKRDGSVRWFFLPSVSRAWLLGVIRGVVCQRAASEHLEVVPGICKCGLSGVEHGRYSCFAGPLSPTDSMEVPTPVNQGSPFGAPNPEQIYGQDCRYDVDDRLADDQSAMCAITRNDDVPSTTARIDPPQPSTFHELAESNPLQGTEFSGHSVLTAGPPVARRKPRDPIGVLKHLERHAAGRATCLWLSGDGHECGYSSQIDLVKRHIKRVHYHIR